LFASSAPTRAISSGKDNPFTLNPYTTALTIMARLLGIDIPNEKRIIASLPYIYGIGPATAAQVLEQAGIDFDTRAGQLTTEQLGAIVAAIQATGLPIEGDLRRDLQLNLKRLQQINCYRGIRHRKSLPVRGQRTQTNARTRKGKRKTIGVVRAKK
jgi:small subunit ribosomal protein S13